MSSLGPNTTTAPGLPARIRTLDLAMLGMMFFLMCFGLGYPTLNRYDPGKIAGTVDAGEYYAVMVRGHAEPPLDTDHRILIPYLARPVLHLAQGRIGTWDAGWFALLVVNSAFLAGTATLILLVGRLHLGDGTTALLGALLFLLNHIVANLELAGLVDAGEVFFLMAVVWCLTKDRWWLLPIVGVPGATVKETFVPLAAAVAAGWWIAAWDQPGRFRRAAWVLALVLAGFGAVTLVMSAQHGRLHLASQFAADVAAAPTGPGWMVALLHSVANHLFVLTFAWLLPLGVWKLRLLPVGWQWGAAAGFAAALAMGAYNDAGNNTVRALFNVVGPILSLSAAAMLAGWFSATRLASFRLGPRREPEP